MHKIKELLKDLRFRLCLISNGYSYSRIMIETFFDRYLGHHKVIKWKKGYPIYSTMVPPLFSEPSARLMGNSFFGNLFDKTIPFQVNLAVEDACNASCEHCSFFDSIHDKNCRKMSKDQYKKIITDIQDIGVCHIGFIGGEPLLNKDIFELIASVDKKRSITTLFTNGFFLENAIPKLYAAGLDTIAISIDDIDLSEHARKRGIPGLDKKIIASLKKAKKYDMNLLMSIYVYEEDYEKLHGFMELARNLKFDEVIIFPAFPSGKLKGKDLKISEEGFRKFKEIVGRYKDDTDYPGIYAYPVIVSKEHLGCQGGKRYFYISPYGDIMQCDFHKKIYGNVLSENISDIITKANKTEENCSECTLINK